MGTFLGHALPGTFFILFAVWELFDGFCKYFRWQMLGKRLSNRYMSTSSIRSSKYAVESVCKLMAAIIGVSAEFVTGFDSDGRFNHHNGQHMTMFFFFGINGGVEILSHCYPHIVPKNLDYLSGLMAFVVEGTLFSWHLKGRSEVDTLSHTLLIYVVWSTVIVVIAEMRFRYDFATFLSRQGTVLLQGTWFYQIGFLLYSPFSNDKPSTDELMLTLIFTWHVAVVAFIVFIMGTSVYCGLRKRKDLSSFHSRENHDERDILLHSDEDIY